ncbi:MAG: hypothetical protein JNM56_32610 [Planctomycetia bacterium]|nr:hypothetical protein [Planctomycetia bacterium]
MNFPSPEFDAVVAAVCHGAASDAETATLYALIAANPAARDEYLWQVELHARLASLDIVPIATTVAPAAPRLEQGRRTRRWLAPVLAITVAAVLLVVAFGAWFQTLQPTKPATVAHFGEVQDARWVAADLEHKAGEAIRAGQRLELSSGQVRIEFGSGASALLQGPAILEVQSANAGLLVLGRVTVMAATPASKGFTMRTRTARVVDRGTEFTAEASADGLSWFGVLSGEIEVHRDGIKAPQRLGKGEMLSLEAGRQQVMVRVERGDETAAFRFPTIEPPSNRDYADARQGKASLRVAQGTLKANNKLGLGGSGPAEVLLDGRGQSAPDAPAESVFFQNEMPGRLLLDLGKAVTVTKINTYTWHQNSTNLDNRLRALQNYTLYGFAGDTAPPTDGELEREGWVTVARVNTDEFFRVVERLDRPAQQACSITAAAGKLGRYRYLLWDVQPSRYPDFKQRNNSFYGEFDVYAQP